MNPLARQFVSLLNPPPATGRVPTFEPQSLLPKLVHQTFPSKVLPPKLRASVDTFRELNPSWRHELYDDADISRFIRSAYGVDVHRQFERIDPTYGAARADLFRYLLLYKCGGLYLDIKSAATRPLDRVLMPDERFVIAQWPSGPGAKFVGAGWSEETKHIPNGEYQQWFIVAAPGHPFLKAVIENVLQNISIYHPVLHGVGKKGVLRLTGPIAYTLAIDPLLNCHPHRRADAERDLGFEYSIYPTVHKGYHEHLRLFKTHYSQATTSIVRLTGINAAIARPLLAARQMAKDLLRRKPAPP